MSRLPVVKKIAAKEDDSQPLKHGI